VTALGPLPSTAADPLGDFVRAHQAAVWRFLRTIGCGAADADELTVETFVVAHDKGAIGDSGGGGNAGDAAAFLRATARYLWLRRQRWRRREQERLAAAAEALWALRAPRDDGSEWLDALAACLERLDGRAAAAVARIHGDGQDRAAVAAALGLRPNGLRTLLHRTRALLRACIEQKIGRRLT
jgi:RNA polymerase sigma-70 factor (ECF subfamily)